MQDRRPRSNAQRTHATRQALVTAARALFVRNGFAQTSTPEIVAAAGVTRGALYHHFRDKGDLFRETLDQEARAVAAEIEARAMTGLPPRQALMAGSEAYLDAMAVPGRTRLLLVEGPAVLGAKAMRQLDEAYAERTLAEGLAAAMAATAAAATTTATTTATTATAETALGPAGGAGRDGPDSRIDLRVAPLAVLLSAAFDRAALAIDAGADEAAFRSALFVILERILGDAPPRDRSPAAPARSTSTPGPRTPARPKAPVRPKTPARSSTRKRS